MSIPKEPRQLMINIMYLVLTALLALNVSAEIFNAFKVVDKGLKASNTALDDANGKLPDIIKERAKKTKALEVYAERVDPARDLSKGFTSYVDDIVNNLIDGSGNNDGDPTNDYREIKGVKELIGKKNTDITTRTLVDGGIGEELKQKILDLREDFLELIDEEDRASFEREVALEIDDESWKNAVNKAQRESWSSFNFRHMPVQAVLPLFTKFKNDAKNTESAVLNYLMSKVGGEEIVLDRFAVVSAPDRTYVINGERFNTEVFLSASASQASNTGVSIRVNGQNLPVDEDGVAQFSQAASGVGVKTYSAEITVTNPVTGEVQTYNKSFEYEVGERSVSVSAAKMNVFYIGVPNPVEISAAGVSSNQLSVSMSGAGGGTISKNSDGTYTVNVTRQTKVNEFANVSVSAPGISVSKPFRVKRIPDPIPTLSGKKAGAIGNGSFKAQRAILPTLEGFDFDAKCAIQGFTLMRAAKREDIQVSINKGGKYTSETLNVINKAKPGDLFVFDNIKCKCPGDQAARTLSSVTYRIQ